MSQNPLASLSLRLSELRAEAIEGRQSSGIEQIWKEDREYYDGIDDANRAEKMLKPATSDGSFQRQRKKKTQRSTIFLNLTSRYVNAAGAYVCDKLIRSDVSNYGLRPTPNPSLIEQSKDETTQATNPDGTPVEAPVTDEQGNQVEQPHVVNGQVMMDNATGQPVMMPATKPVSVAEVAKKAIADAKAAAEKAKVQIDDWLVECGINGQSRKVVMDSAQIGTGVLYGPAPTMIKNSAVLTRDGKTMLEIEEKMVPQSRRISVWNLYPDPSCGTDIHRGKYVFQDDEINSRLLEALKDDPSYIADNITRVLEEGPKHAVTGTLKRKKDWTKGKTELFQIWYFHGYMSGEELEACGCDLSEGEEVPQEELGLIESAQGEAEPSEEVSDQGDPPENVIEAGDMEVATAEEQAAARKNKQYPCIVVMVNDVVIKAMLSQFDSGRFPYNVMCWQYREDHWAGIGVARQMRTSQDGVNAGVRMLHDNAGVAGAPILIINRKMLEPADGVWSVGPHKVYYTTEDFEGGDIRQAMNWIITPSLQAETMNIIQFWMHAAEEETGMPMLLQGQQDQTQKTLGEAQMLNNNGSALLRRVTNIYDDDVTKHHIGAYYEYLLLHGEDDSVKGDFTIDALGSSVLIERDAQGQVLMQMLGMSLNPAYGADPELVYKEFLLSQRFDPEKLKYTDEKKAEMAKRPPPEDPRVTAAKIMAQSKIDIEKLDDKDQADHAAAQAHLQMNDQQFRSAEAEKDRNLSLMIEQGNKKIERQRLAGASAQTIQQLKVKLAEKTMALQMQDKLSLRAFNQSNDHAAANHMVNLHKHRTPAAATPPTEPVGKAAPGQSFSQ